MPFLNREDELRALDERWRSTRAELFVLWGRRRVGKSELLSELIAGKRGLFFEATKATARDQLRDLSLALADAGAGRLFREQPLTTWEAALTAIEQLAGEKRTIVVFDEFQYLVQRSPELPTLLNRWWRTTGRRLPVVLVLAGSEVAFFEREVLSASAAMYGRRTGQLHLLPFDYRSAGLFHPQYGPEDRVRAYAVCGGMPFYLEQLDPERPLSESILRSILYRDGLLREEAGFLLSQELPEPDTYMSILRAIANGAARNSQIRDRTGLSGSTISQAVTLLQSMQLVRRRHPVTVANPDRTRMIAYEITDGFLRFWFRFVAPYESRLQRRDGAERHLADTVLPNLDRFVSKPAFELICQEHMDSVERAAAVGYWWGQVPTGKDRRTEQREIDAVAIDADGMAIAVGTCKWTDSPLGIGEERLLDRLEPHLPVKEGGPRRYFYSRSGFDPEIERLAQTHPDRYTLVTPADLYAPVNRRDLARAARSL